MIRIGILGLAILLAACSEQEPAPDPDIAITTSNYQLIIAVAYDAYTMRANVSQNFDNGIRFAEGDLNRREPLFAIEADRTQPILPPPFPYDFYYPCTGGGETGTEVTSTGVTIARIDCYEEDETETTLSSFSTYTRPDIFSPSPEITTNAFVYSFDSFVGTFTDGSGNYYYEGFYEYQQSEQNLIDLEGNKTKLETVSWLGQNLRNYVANAEGTIVFDQQLYNYNLQDVRYSNTLNEVLSTEFDMSFTLYSSLINGIVNVQSNSSIQYTGDTETLTAGSIQFNGLNSTAIVSYGDATLATVQIDENNDGVFELETQLDYSLALPELSFVWAGDAVIEAE